jgi:hypothetical protein
MRHALPAILLVLIACSVQAEQKAESVTEVEWAELAFVAKDRAAFRAEELPDQVRRLEGKLVRVRGYFYPGTAGREVREFLLVGEISTKPTVLKFGLHTLPIHQLAAVEMVAGKTAKVIVGQPISVIGRLTFKVAMIDGEAYLVYHIAADTIEPVKQRPGYGPALTSGC